MDPHTPYLPPAPYDRLFYAKDPCDPAVKSMEEVFACEAFADYFRSWMPEGITDAEWGAAMYDSELAYMDACIEHLMQRMRELGIEEDTLVVVTGDHGETLLEHGCYFDHHGLYECTLVVPLFFYWPGKIKSGVRSEAMTLHEDLMPTLLDICGLKKFAKGIRFDGVSLKKYFSDTEGTPRSEFYISECTWMRKEGWRTPTWKYWEALEPDFHGKPPVELYNLAEDPGEEKNLAKKEPEICALMKARKDVWVEKREKETGKTSNIKNYWIGTEKKIGSVATAQQLQAR
jgi:arylsulfatase A-like enzyme